MHAMMMDIFNNVIALSLFYFICNECLHHDLPTKTLQLLCRSGKSDIASTAAAQSALKVLSCRNEKNI